VAAIRIFSSDEHVLAIFESIRVYLAFTVFFMTTSDTMEAVMIAQGRARAVAISTTIASWLVHVPASFLLVHYWRDDMEGLYLGVAVGYAFLTVLCLYLLVTSKWELLVSDAQSRSEVVASVTEPPLDALAKSATALTPTTASVEGPLAATPEF
jgi:Na+-driven multidrug efflux pump